MIADTTAVAGRAGRPSRVPIVILIIATIALVPAAAVVPVRLLIAAAGACALAAVAYAHPPAAAYLLLVATPLTAGIERDVVVPVLRPHEALGLVLGAGVAARALVQVRSGHRLPLRPGPIDAAILLMAGASSVLPLLWMAARGLTPTFEDLLYAATIWKFYGLFLLIRTSVRSEAQVRRCLQCSIAGAGVLGVVAILQSLQVAGVPELVATYYPLGGGLPLSPGRGSATLASPIAVGDVMAYNLAICLGWLLRIRRHRGPVAGMAVLFACGTIASGQFSGVIALVVAVFAVAVVTGQVRRLLMVLVPISLVGAFVLKPVLDARLSEVDVSTGLPQSWWVRMENLRLFVWPEVSSGLNWLFGVRPTATIDVSAPWGTFIYIESGHTWLLWTGGVPFFLAFLFFSWMAVRSTAAIAHAGHDVHGAVGVAAIASFASLLVMFVLMSFDPHLTMRGTADLLFSLLALATAVPVANRAPADPPRTPTSNSSAPTPRRAVGPAPVASPGPDRSP